MAAVIKASPSCHLFGLTCECSLSFTNNGAHMKRFNYIAIGLAILCFGGAVFATGITSNDMSPDVDRLISYLNQAQSQEQAF